MGYHNIEVIEATRTEQAALQDKFAVLMDSLKKSDGEKRPAHTSTYSAEELEEISKKAAAIIHDAAPRIEQAVVKLAKQDVKPGLFVRKLPFEKDVPPPALHGTTANQRTESDIDGRDYFQNERRGTFSDFFTMGVKHIITDATGYRPPKIMYTETVNGKDRTRTQPFHRDYWESSEDSPPRYGTLSTFKGNFTGKTSLVAVNVIDAAIEALTLEQKKTLCEPRYWLREKPVSVLQENNGKFTLARRDFIPNVAEQNDPIAQQALDALLKPINAKQDQLTSYHGDFLLFDQQRVFHRGSKVDIALGRHVSGVFFSTANPGGRLF
jgi:hypothetical protein